MTYAGPPQHTERVDAVWYDPCGDGQRTRIGTGRICERGVHEDAAAFEHRVKDMVAAAREAGIMVTALHVPLGHGLYILLVSEPPTPAPLPRRMRRTRGGRH